MRIQVMITSDQLTFIQILSKWNMKYVEKERKY